MGDVQRKQCADCGHANLQGERVCWACGCHDFVPVGTASAGERTVAIGGVFERTLGAARIPRVIPTSVLYGVGGATLALIIGLSGYWIGRASSAAQNADSPPPATQIAAQPVSLPAPSVWRTTVAQPGVPVYPSALSQPMDPPVVTFRARPGKPAPPTAGAAGTSAAPPPGPVLPVAQMAGPMSSPPPSRRVDPPSSIPAPQRPRVDARMEARVSPAPGGPVSAPPTATSSVVNLRNDASTPVEVEITLDGKSIRTALIAPDSLVPLRLPPGAYQVRAAGRGATSGQSTLAVAANRTHGLLIQRRQNDGKDVLVFIEPLEPSADD